MAFTRVEGDLFAGDYDAIGHGVNCKGVMGAGIAREFRSRYHRMYAMYRALCVGGWLAPGSVFEYNAGDRWIFNIASQDEPGANATLDAVESGLHQAMFYAERAGCKTLAIPEIGCGIGGLRLDEVIDICEELGDMYDGDVDLIMVSLPKRENSYGPR